MDIIDKYPEKPWNWNCISVNLNITIDFINKHDKIMFIKQQIIVNTLLIHEHKQGLIGALPKDVLRYMLNFI